MVLISNQAKPARPILAVVTFCQRAGERLFRQTHAIFKHQSTRRFEGAALVLLTTFCLVFLAGVPQPHANKRGLTVSEAWRGTWEVTVSYRDHETGALVATDVTTAAICPGEPIAPPLLNTLLHISGEADESKVSLSCHAKHSPRPGCNVFVDVSLDSHLDGDTWNGTGSWITNVVGNCEHIDFGEDFVVTGRRVSSDAVCDGETSSLLQRFFAHSLLVPVLPRRN